MLHLLFAYVDTSLLHLVHLRRRRLLIPSTTELRTSPTRLAPNMAATEEVSLALRVAQEAYIEQKDRCVTCRAVPSTYA